MQRRCQCDNDELLSKVEALRGAKSTLSIAIGEAKAKSWREFVETLDDNPWGRPYQLVRDKLRQWALPYTESLEPRVLEEVLGGLFPPANEEDHWAAPPAAPTGPSTWKDSLSVTEEEILAARKRMLTRNAAPGESGVHARIWGIASATGILADRMRALYTECLKQGQFPRTWRGAKLVLLRKTGKPADEASGYRPICLIEEEAKLFERIILGRVTAHLEKSVANDLHARQFGFRRGRSTVDAILCVTGFIKEAWGRGRWYWASH